MIAFAATWLEQECPQTILADLQDPTADSLPSAMVAELVLSANIRLEQESEVSYVSLRAQQVFGPSLAQPALLPTCSIRTVAAE